MNSTTAGGKDAYAYASSHPATPPATHIIPSLRGLQLSMQIAREGLRLQRAGRHTVARLQGSRAS